MSSEAVKYTSRSRFVYTQTTKTGVSRGAQPPWLWVSNRGERHPCWHTTFSRKVWCVIPLRSRWKPELSHAPESVAAVAAFWRERLPLMGQHKRQKKAGKRDRYALPASRILCLRQPAQPLIVPGRHFASPARGLRWIEEIPSAPDRTCPTLPFAHRPSPLRSGRRRRKSLPA